MGESGGGGVSFYGMDCIDGKNVNDKFACKYLGILRPLKWSASFDRRIRTCFLDIQTYTEAVVCLHRLAAALMPTRNKGKRFDPGVFVSILWKSL